MRYGLSKSKRDQRRTFGYAALLLWSGALLFIWPRRKAKEPPVVPTGAAAEFDPKRRRELVAMAGVAAAGGAGLAAMKAGVPLPHGFSGAAPAVSVAGMVTGGQALQVPAVTQTPQGAPPGALFYREDLGQMLMEDGTIGTGHERFVGQQTTVVVSPVGLKNGLSTLWNGGWGMYGPDYYPGTTTYAVQEALTAQGKAGGGIVQLLPGAYVCTSTPTVSYPGVGLIGTPQTYTYTSTGNIPDISQVTAIGGSVLHITSNGIDGFLTDRLVSGCVFSNFTILFDSSLTSTGHGLRCESISDPNAAANHYAGLVYSSVDGIVVYNTDVNHDGLRLVNFLELNVGVLRAYWSYGRGFYLGNTNAGFNYGNSHFGQVIAEGGFSGSYAGAIVAFAGYSNSTGLLNLFKIDRLQVQSFNSAANFISGYYTNCTEIHNIDCEGTITEGDPISLTYCEFNWWVFAILSPVASGSGTDYFTVGTGCSQNIFVGPFGGVSLNDPWQSDLYIDLCNSPKTPQVSGGAAVLNSNGLTQGQLMFNNIGSYNTTSSTQVVVGGTGPMRPDYYGRMKVIFDADFHNSTSGDGLVLTLYRSTVGVPSQGSAPSGSDTQKGTFGGYITPASGGPSTPLHKEFIDVGLSNDTQYYYYWAIEVYIGGQAYISSCQLTQKQP